MKKTPQQSLWTGQSWQREHGEKSKPQSWPSSPPKQQPQFCPSQAGGWPCRSPAIGSWYGSLRRTSGNTLLPLENSKQHLEIKYFEAVSGPGPQSQKNCIREDSSEGLLIDGLYLASLGVPLSIFNQKAVHKSPISLISCRESPAEMLLPFKRTIFESE